MDLSGKYGGNRDGGERKGREKVKLEKRKEGRGKGGDWEKRREREASPHSSF